MFFQSSKTQKDKLKTTTRDVDGLDTGQRGKQDKV